MDTMTAPITATEILATVEEKRVESNNERRHRMRIEASQKHAALVQATKALSLEERAERLSDGFEGREGYVAWSQDTRDAIRDALDGGIVTLTLSRVAATKRGTRVAVTGITNAAGRVVAIRGEATVMDAGDASGMALNGATVEVKLTAKRGERRNGTPFTGFTGMSVGVASTGQRIGLRVTVQASRHVRVAASAL